MNKWAYPILAVLLATFVSTMIMATIADYKLVYSLALIPSLVIVWIATRISREEIGLTLGNYQSYILAIIYPVGVIGILALLALFIANVNFFFFAGVFIIIILDFVITLLLAFITDNVFFRGELFGMLEREEVDSWKILLFTGVTFSLWHIPLIIIAWEIYDINPLSNAIFLISVAITGVNFGILRLYSGSILAPTLAHTIWNTMITYLFGGLTLVSQLIYNPERGFLGILFNLIAFGFLYYYCKDRYLKKDTYEKKDKREKKDKPEKKDKHEPSLR